MAGLLAEYRDAFTLQLFIAAVVLLVLTRVLAPVHHERLRGSITLFGLHLALVTTAGLLRETGAMLYRETRMVGLIFAILSFSALLGTFLFGGVLLRLRIVVPRILQDVLVAAAAITAIFAVVSSLGVNLSGLIATSAVLTAIIGLAFQDTLGNVVGGLALQLDRSVGIGDWIKIGDVSGRVTELRWRYTAIETRNWETVVVPNSLLVKGQVTILGRRLGEDPKWRRWVYFNVDFRFPPTEVIAAVTAALRDAHIANVAPTPEPNCVLMDLTESYARYAVRYFILDFAVDDPTDSVVRTRVYFALRRANIPLSIPAHALFVTEESDERREEKQKKDFDRRMAALARVELFANLSEDERKKLAEGLFDAPFAAGEVMTRQGSVAHWLYMVLEGEASVRIEVDETEREVARISAGGFFGEMGLLTGERRAATVVALTRVHCYRLDKAVFKKLLDQRPELAEHVADVLARRSLALSEARADLTSADAVRVTRTDLLDKIRAFFSLDDPPTRRK